MNGLFIEENSFGGIVLEEKKDEMFYFVPVDNQLIVPESQEDDNYEREEREKAMEHGLQKFYTKCFTCEKEHYLFVNKKNVEGNFVFERYLSSYKDMRYQINPPYVKSITRTNGDEVLEKIETNLYHQVKETGLCCPSCGESNIHFDAQVSSHVFLNENERYFQIKFYGHNYAHSFKGMNKLTKKHHDYFDDNGNQAEMSVVSIPFSYQVIFDKEKNATYIRFGNKIMHTNRDILFLRLDMNIKDEMYITFLQDILYFYQSKFNQYQKQILDFTQEIQNIRGVGDFVHLFEKIKYHLSSPFSFEAFGEKNMVAHTYISFSTYIANKIKKAKSGKEIIDSLFVKSTKKMRKLIYEYYSTENPSKSSNLDTIVNLIRYHKNIGLNELVLEKVCRDNNVFYITQKSIFKSSPRKTLTYKELYSLLNKYLSIDNIFSLYLKEKNTEEFNRTLRDTIIMLVKIDSYISNKAKLVLNEKRNKSIQIAKLSLKELKEKEKLSLKRIHDKLVLIFNEVDKTFEEFDYTKEELALNYENKEHDITIQLYDNSIQLKESATRLKNCAYSYTNRVKEKSLVLFELKNNGKEKMCIEVVENKIVQAKLSSNQVINQDTPKVIVDSLIDWINTKNLTIQTSDLHHIELQVK